MSWRDRISGLFRRKKTAADAADETPGADRRRHDPDAGEAAPEAAGRGWRDRVVGVFRRKKAADGAAGDAPEADVHEAAPGDEEKTAEVPGRNWREKLFGFLRRKKKPARDAAEDAPEAAEAAPEADEKESAPDGTDEAHEPEVEPKRGGFGRVFGFLRRKKPAAQTVPEEGGAAHDAEEGAPGSDEPHRHIVLLKMAFLVLCVIGAAAGVGWFIWKNYPVLSALREPPRPPVKPVPIEAPVKPISIAPPVSAVSAVMPLPEKIVDFIKPSALASASKPAETPTQAPPASLPSAKRLPARPPQAKTLPAGPALSLQQQADDEFRRAAALERQGDAAGALAAYDSALRLDAGYLPARRAQADLLLKQGRSLDAEHVLQEGLKRDPSNTAFAMRLAHLQLARKAVWSALLTLQKSEPYAARQADYQALMAELLAHVGHHKEAVMHFRTAVQINPSSGTWYMAMGMSLRALQRNDEARAAFLQAQETHALNASQEAQVAQWLKAPAAH